MFEGWVREAQPQPKTEEEWRKHIESFTTCVGHDDASKLVRANVLDWKDHLLSLGNAPKTINGGKLAALRAVLQWGVDNGRLEHNVAVGVNVKRSAKAGHRMRGFERDEAAAILKAAKEEKSPVYRWVPLLCAQAGARVAEVCQLRAEDIRQQEGIWYMHIRSEAGSLKTEAAERKVPLHPYVITSGFLEFVKQTREGPMFYDPRKRKPGAKKPPAKIVAKNVAAWVHRLGLNVGRQHRKDPNHGWRHLFRTMALERSIPSEVIRAIQGHAPGNASEAYGEVPLAVKAREIAKVPLPGVWDGEVQVV